MTLAHIELTPLERLQLRETLQDAWRDQVRRITELSLDLYTASDPDDDRNIDPAAVAIALSQARFSLDEIEQAMRRLDDRSYGSCVACFARIPLAVLVDSPQVSYCAECRNSISGNAAPIARTG